jgi:hypothetical protein
MLQIHLALPQPLLKHFFKNSWCLPLLDVLETMNGVQDGLYQIKLKFGFISKSHKCTKNNMVPPPK